MGHTQSKVVAGAYVASVQGRRKEMEDQHVCLPQLRLNREWAYFAVFDGHNGSTAAEFCAKH